MKRSGQSWIGIRGIAVGMATAMMFVLATLPTQAQTLTVLHTFTGAADGGVPLSGLTMDAGGNLYGTSSHGAAGYGEVFKLAHKGQGWIFTPLYTFQGAPNDGANPVARVIFGPDGTLYGTTENGGDSTGFCHGGCGSVFNLRPPPTACTTALCPWQETVLYDFAVTDPVYGALPESEVIFDGAGNLYGTSYGGGYYDKPGGGSGCVECGLVYKLTPSSGGWTESVPYSFSGYQYGDDGAFPVGGLTFDSAGDLYGTTTQYGDCGFGIIFELTPNGSSWSEHLLHDFCTGGANPTATMITDASGTFYGTTQGEYSGYGTQHGSVFTFAPSGSGWVYTPIYTFPQYGGGPAAQLFRDSAGNLYGTTITGGSNPLGLCSNGCGTIFKLTPSNGSWTYTELYDFTGGSDGAAPYSNLVQDANGNFYGTTSSGGSNGCSRCGVVFEFTP
ncbi:MAG: choice-of-anchor tandem repeat GloVer-containing protein [Candidatus Korobacteraceae bacterium]|jgi:uncharacterized repeat protein (TIGR03803 family)